MNETKNKRHVCPCCGARLHSIATGSACGQCNVECASSELGALRHDFFWDSRSQSYVKNTRAANFSTPDDNAPEPVSLTEIGENKLAQMRKTWRAE